MEELCSSAAFQDDFLLLPVDVLDGMFEHCHVCFVQEVLVSDEGLVLGQRRELFPENVIVLEVAVLADRNADNGPSEALSEGIDSS